MNLSAKLRLLIAVTIPLLGMVACQKDLETTPITNIEEQYAFDTPERIQGMVNGLYDAAKAGNFLGGRYLIMNDIRGEEFINMRTNVVTGLSIWNHTANSSASEVENLWSAAYAAINKVNIFLKGLDDHAAKIDPLMLPKYKAEAKFVRALAYFDLVVIYARPYTLNNGSSPGLPLRLKAETTSDNNDLARSSVKAVYDLILADLDEAEKNLPENYATALLNVTRAHVSTAIALKTRVYLAMGDYKAVVREAEKIAGNNAIGPLVHKLEPNVATPFTNYLTTESILSMPMSDGDPPGTQNQLGYYYNKSPIGNGEYSLNAKGIIANTDWSATDARRTNFIIPGTAAYLKKFNKPAPYTDYVPVIRFAETLLNYAEAAARTGDSPKAIELLKMIRNRSDAAYVFPSSATDTPDELIKTILTERRIELLGEGFRSFDLLRLGMTIPAKGTVNAITPSQAEYIWPIPNSEMLSNKLMTQN